MVQSLVVVFSLFLLLLFFFFFFQAEDGIRDGRVTGVQTCALPISRGSTIRRLRPTTGRWWTAFPTRCASWKRSPDRKSTRLNSSHPSISYAVFCLKKKKKTKALLTTPLSAGSSVPIT